MFPYNYDPYNPYNYDKSNRRSWYPQQNSYVGNAKLYGQQNQPYWNFDYPRSPINDYYCNNYYNNNNNNHWNRRRNNNQGSYPNRNTIQSTNRGINNVTISPSINNSKVSPSINNSTVSPLINNSTVSPSINNSTVSPSINNSTVSPSIINKEADVLETSESDKKFAASNIIENGAETIENIEENTTIPYEINYKDGNNEEGDMDIDSDVDTVPYLDVDTTFTTSPYSSDYRSYLNFLNPTKNNSTKEETTETTPKTDSKKIKTTNSTAGEEFNPIRPAKRRERSASIPSDLDSLLKSLGSSSIITRSKSRENLLLQEEMLTITKKMETNEKNSEMSAEKPKRIFDKSANKPNRRSSMFVAKSNTEIKPNAETKPQLLNRDPRLQKRDPLKMTIKSMNGREGSIATISSSTSLPKAPTPQKDAHQNHQKKKLIKTLFGDEDSPPKQSQIETVKTTLKEKEKKKEKHSKRKYDTSQKTKSSSQVKSDSTAKRHKSAANSRKSEKSTSEKKIAKNLNMSINVEVELMEEVVQTSIPELEMVPKTAQPLIHGELIPPHRVTETSLQLCDDQVGIIDLENLPEVPEDSVDEDLLIKTERLVEEFGCEGYPSSDNRNSPVTEDSDIFEYFKESVTNNYEIIASDQNFDSSYEHTSDIPQINATTDETSVHSPPLLYTSMEVQEIKYIPPETADVKPVLPKEPTIIIEDEDQVEELVKIEHTVFADKFACDLHCYHIVENTVYELSVNTATSIESKNNYLELFESRKQVFDRISKTMYAYFRKHEILNFNCKSLIEEVKKAYTRKCNSTITNLKILRFLHNIILTWRKPANSFMKQFCDDIGHCMMLSNMETDHENNQPPKSTISSTSETVITKDSTSSQTCTVATTTSSAQQTITISPRPIEQLLAKPPVQQPISNQHQPPLFSPSSTQSQGASYQITSPQSSSRTADSLPPPSFQSTFEDHLNITASQNSMESPVNRIPPAMPASSQIQSSTITKPKGRPAKKVVNKAQNQFAQPSQILPQPPPTYSTYLNTIENLHRNMIPAQNIILKKNISSPTYHSRLQPNQNLLDTRNIAEVPTSQTPLWPLQHMANVVQARSHSKQFQNNSTLNTCHPRYLQPPGMPVHLMQSRPQLLTKNTTHGSQFHEQVQSAPSVNSNTYYPGYSMYHNYTENQQRQHEVLPRAPTALVENLPNDHLYFHGHELENHNTRLQTAQLQHQVAMQPSLLIEQLGRPLRNSAHGYLRQSEVPTAQPRDAHSSGTFDSTDSCLRSPLNLSSQFAVPHPSATPRANSQRTSQHEQEQQFQRLTGQAKHILKLPSQQGSTSQGSSDGNHSSLNQPLHPISSSRVAEITSTSRTPDIENSIPPSVGKSYTTPNNAGLNSEPIVTTVVVKTEVVVPKQIDTMECIVIDDDDDDDDDNNSHCEDPGLSSPTITSSLNAQTQDNSLIINLSKVCICNEEAIFICVCKKALYCSIECQKKDWKKHSFVCA